MRNEPGFLDLRQWIDLLEREASYNSRYRAYSANRAQAGSIVQDQADRR